MGRTGLTCMPDNNINISNTSACVKAIILAYHISLDKYNTRYMYDFKMIACNHRIESNNNYLSFDFKASHTYT